MTGQGPSTPAIALARQGVAMVGLVAFLAGGGIAAMVASFLPLRDCLLAAGVTGLCAAMIGRILWRSAAVTTRFHPMRGALAAMLTVPVSAFCAAAALTGLEFRGVPRPPMEELLGIAVAAAAAVTITRLGLLTLPVAAATGFLVARWCEARRLSATRLA